ncbi:MAG: cytochrome c-type biogenesis protein CcmH [Gammaproteobacteria bacterium]|nr:cytochrome c-type biogenesis protein CcmH [Gammaproteobacteria bacterium]
MQALPRIVRAMVACVLLAWCGAQSNVPRAADAPMEFSDPAQEQRYQELLSELRCLVCQNQTLADSHADLAQDLREEIHTRVLQGQGKDEIIAYLVARYGDFVRYRPPLTAGTLLLWLGPFLLLAAAFVILFRIARSRRIAAEALTVEEQARVRALLEDPDRH